jgi:hypothetical protein
MYHDHTLFVCFVFLLVPPFVFIRCGVFVLLFSFSIRWRAPAPPTAARRAEVAESYLPCCFKCGIPHTGFSICLYYLCWTRLINVDAVRKEEKQITSFFLFVSFFFINTVKNNNKITPFFCTSIATQNNKSAHNSKVAMMCVVAPY